VSTTLTHTKCVIEPLINPLQDEDGRVRDRAVEALQGIGEPAVEQLTIAISNEDNGFIRSVETRVLGYVHTTSVVQPLVDLLQDKDARVRDAAVVALRKKGAPAAEALIVVLVNEGNALIRSLAVSVLRDIADACAVQPLITVVQQDDDLRIRAMASEALREIGTPEALAALDSV
jgi:HEAT repeat protein